MKKSFKCFLLALMVLCLSATVGFADGEKHASADIDLTFTLTPNDANSVDISLESNTFKVKSTDVVSQGYAGVINSFASVDTTLTEKVTISYDKSVTELKLKVDVDTSKKSDATIEGMWLSSEDDALTESDKVKTFTNNELAISKDYDGWYLLIAFIASSDTTDGTPNIHSGVRLQLNIVESSDEPVGGAFESATVKAYQGSTTALATYSFAPASADETITLSGITADTNVSFDITNITPAGSLIAVSVDNGAAASEDTAATGDGEHYYVLGANGTKVNFVFASNDATKPVIITVTLSTGSDSGTGSDYGTIHFVALSGDTTVSSFDVASGDYKSGLSASNDSTVTAISKTGSFPTTATVKITIDEGTNGRAKVYDIYSGTDSVSDDYTASTGVFDPKTVAGTYKVVFVGSETAEKPYFAVSFTVTDSTAPATIDPEDVESTKGSDTEAKAPSSVTTDADGNTVTYIPANFNLPVTLKDGVWTFTSIASKYVAIAVAALEAITTDDLVTMLTSTADSRFAPDSNGEYKYVGAKLKKKVYPGTIFIIRLVLNSTGGSVNAAAATTIDGAMTVEGDDANTATDTLAIDTTDLRSTSNGDTVVDVPAGDYDITYSSLNGEVVGGLDETVSLAGNGETTVTGSNKGSSSGCDAGFGALALLALALPLVKKIKK